jgi:transposase-like protein
MNLLLVSLAALFKGRHFDHDIITLCVRWYVTYKLSYRDLANMMAERGIEVAPYAVNQLCQGKERKSCCDRELAL